MSAVLAIDEGSSGVRAIVFDRGGRVRARAYREIEAAYPMPGQVEHDLGAIWDCTLEVAREALGAAGLVSGDLAGIGVTGQRSTAVAWDRSSGEPLHPALSWQDLRAAARADELMAAGYFTTPLAAALKLEWMGRHVPEVSRAIERGTACFGTIESWLVWKLTGGESHVTDESFASASGLYDYFTRGWNEDLLADLGLPADALPKIRPSSEVYGTSQCALGSGVPVAGLAGDQQAAMFGQACFEVGSVKASLGTSAMVDANVGEELHLSSQGGLPMVLWQLSGRPTYCLEGQALTAGAAVQWLRDGLGIIGDAADTNELAQSVKDSGGAWAVPAFQGLGTPHQDPSARAAVGGLSRGTTRAHLVRAMLEGVALRCREVVVALAADSPGGMPATLRVDGGVAANDFLLQFLSDVLDVPVERPETLEAAASGAAFLAGLATGVWRGLDEVRSSWRLGARFEPRMSETQRSAHLDRFASVLDAVRRLSA